MLILLRSRLAFFFYLFPAWTERECNRCNWKETSSPGPLSKVLIWYCILVAYGRMVLRCYWRKKYLLLVGQSLAIFYVKIWFAHAKNITLNISRSIYFHMNYNVWKQKKSWQAQKSRQPAEKLTFDQKTKTYLVFKWNSNNSSKLSHNKQKFLTYLEFEWMKLNKNNLRRSNMQRNTISTILIWRMFTRRLLARLTLTLSGLLA